MTFKGNEILLSIEGLLGESTFSRTWEAPLNSIISNPNLESTMDLVNIEEDTYATAVIAVVEQYTEFYRRITLPYCRRYPFRMWWLIASPPGVTCPCRGHIAVEMLTDERIKDDTTLKLVRLFQADLRVVANTGTAGIRLWTLLHDGASIMRPSIRDIEGYNSIMKWMGKIAPNIKLKLMASRLALKKMLGGSGQDCQDQSRMARLSARERRERVLDGMVERHAQTIAILRQCQDLSRDDEWLPQALASLMGAPDESFELSACLADEAEEFIVEEEELDEDEANEARELIVHEGFQEVCEEAEDPDERAVLAPLDAQGGEAHLQYCLDNLWDHAPEPTFTGSTAARCAKLVIRMRTSYKNAFLGVEFGASAKHALMIKRWVEEDRGDSTEEWFLITEKVGRATFWTLSLEMADGGVRLRFQTPAMLHHILCSMFEESPKAKIEFSIASLEWQSTYYAEVCDLTRLPLQYGAQVAPKEVEAVVEGWDGADAAEEEKLLAIEDKDGDSPTEEVEEEDASCIAFLLGLPADRPQASEFDCPGGELNDFIEATKTAMEMGGTSAELSPTQHRGGLDQLSNQAERAEQVARLCFENLSALIDSLMDGERLKHIVHKPVARTVSLLSVGDGFGGEHVRTLRWWFWDCVGRERGRWTSIDKHNAIVYAPPNAGRQLPQGTVALMHTSVAMLRHSEGLRQVLLEQVVAACRFFERAQATLDSVVVFGEAKCAVCEEIIASHVGVGEGKQCPACGVYMHTGCLDYMCRAVKMVLSRPISNEIAQMLVGNLSRCCAQSLSLPI